MCGEYVRVDVANRGRVECETGSLTPAKQLPIAPAEERPMRTICEWVDVGRGALELSYLAGDVELGLELELVETPEGPLAVWTESQEGAVVAITEVGRA